MESPEDEEIHLTERRARQHVCPKCLAPVGTMCVTKSGKTSTLAHVGRYEKLLTTLGKPWTRS